MRYINPIDPHVHLRGTEYETDFWSLGLEDAAAVGLCALLEMPNCEPNIIDYLTYNERRGRYTGELYHGIHVGLTNNMHENRKTLGWCTSDKIFYTNSTGDMGILDPDVQEQIWKLKGKMKYKGVSIGHFEDEAMFTSDFDYKNPFSHSIRQGQMAEVTCVQRQIRNAVDYKFQGTFYVAHVSSPETVRLLRSRSWPFPVVIEATWHHIFLSTNDYTKHGNRIKCNPPIRGPRSQEQLLCDVLNGGINLIGSDHAPHPLWVKDSDTPPSGLPGLPFWPRGIELLRQRKCKDLDNLIFHNANKIFNLGLEPKTVDIEYDPSLWDKYGYNPYSRLGE